MLLFCRFEFSRLLPQSQSTTDLSNLSYFAEKSSRTLYLDSDDNHDNITANKINSSLNYLYPGKSREQKAVEDQDSSLMQDAATLASLSQGGRPLEEEEDEEDESGAKRRGGDSDGGLGDDEDDEEKDSENAGGKRRKIGSSPDGMRFYIYRFFKQILIFRRSIGICKNLYSPLL